MASAEKYSSGNAFKNFGVIFIKIVWFSMGNTIKIFETSMWFFFFFWDQCHLQEKPTWSCNLFVVYFGPCCGCQAFFHFFCLSWNLEHSQCHWRFLWGRAVLGDTPSAAVFPGTRSDALQPDLVFSHCSSNKLFFWTLHLFFWIVYIHQSLQL